MHSDALASPAIAAGASTTRAAIAKLVSEAGAVNQGHETG